jgi:hypothetical protein
MIVLYVYRFVNKKEWWGSCKLTTINMASKIYDKVTCSKCNKIRLRRSVEGDKPFVYRDEKDRRWEGKKCPSCLLKKFKEYYQKKKFGLLSNNTEIEQK